MLKHKGRYEVEHMVSPVCLHVHITATAPCLVRQGILCANVRNKDRSNDYL